MIQSPAFVAPSTTSILTWENGINNIQALYGSTNDDNTNIYDASSHSNLSDYSSSTSFNHHPGPSPGQHLQNATIDRTTSPTTPSEENNSTPAREEDPTTILHNTDTEDANSAPAPLPRRSKRIQDCIARATKAASLAALQVVGIVYLFNSDVQPTLLAHDLQNPCTDRIPTPIY